MMDGGRPATGIGQPVRRREDLRLLTGNGRYSDDVNLPGQAYAVMVRSPHAHALIRGIDTAAASAAPGVLAVLTHADVVADGLNPLPNIANSHPADISIQNKDGSPVGPAGAAARSSARRCAMSARSSPPSIATASPPPRMPPNWSRSITRCCRRSPMRWPPPSPARRGRAGTGPTSSSTAKSATQAATEAAFARAAHVVRFDTWVQRIAGVPMEPRAAIGEYDPETGRYTLHAGAGGAVSPRRDLAIVLGVPPEQARVVMHDVGGNFGTRGGFNAEFAIVDLGGAAGRPAGQMDLRALGIFRLRPSGPRPRGHGRTGARRATEDSWRCAARTWSTRAPTRSPSAPSTRGSRSCRASTTCRRCISAPAPR